MMSASPSMILLNFRGVTSLQTLNARKKASSIVSSSRSGVCPKILQKKKTIIAFFFIYNFQLIIPFVLENEIQKYIRYNFFPIYVIFVNLYVTHLWNYLLYC